MDLSQKGNPLEEAESTRIYSTLATLSSDEPGGILYCPLCSYSSNVMKYFRRHLRLHQATTLHCPHCPYKTKIKYHMNRHINTHSKRSVLKCSQCSYETLRSDQLQCHMRTHNKPRGIDKLHFKVSSVLLNSDRLPVGKFVFSCKFCSYSTTWKSNFRRHMIMHGQLWKCPLCIYFTRKTALMSKHISNKHAHEEMCLKCSDCSFQAKETVDYVLHLQSHRYKCLFCKDVFIKKIFLDNHIKFKHGSYLHKKIAITTHNAATLKKSIVRKGTSKLCRKKYLTMKKCSPGMIDPTSVQKFSIGKQKSHCYNCNIKVRKNTIIDKNIADRVDIIISSENICNMSNKGLQDISSITEKRESFIENKKLSTELASKRVSSPIAHSADHIKPSVHKYISRVKINTSPLSHVNLGLLKSNKNTGEIELFNRLNKCVCLGVEKFRFACNLCSFQTTTRKYLNRHIKRHEHNAHFKSRECTEIYDVMGCPICSFKTGDADLLANHVNKHTDVIKTVDNKIISPLSVGSKNASILGDNKFFNTSFCTVDSLVQSNNIQESVSTCQEIVNNTCSERTFSPSKTKYSGIINIESNKLSVENCESFGILSQDTRLLATEQGSIIFQCGKCSFSSTLKRDFMHHSCLSRGKRELHCPNCTYRTRHSGHMSRHIKLHAQGMLCCDQCKFISRRPSVMEHHKLAHKNAHFKCHLCNYITLRKELLARHIRRHILPHPAYCRLCDFTTDNRQKMVSHASLSHSSTPRHVFWIHTDGVQNKAAFAPAFRYDSFGGRAGSNADNLMDTDECYPVNFVDTLLATSDTDDSARTTSNAEASSEAVSNSEKEEFDFIGFSVKKEAEELVNEPIFDENANKTLIESNVANIDTNMLLGSRKPSSMSSGLESTNATKLAKARADKLFLMEEQNVIMQTIQQILYQQLLNDSPELKKKLQELQELLEANQLKQQLAEDALLILQNIKRCCILPDFRDENSVKTKHSSLLSSCIDRDNLKSDRYYYCQFCPYRSKYVAGVKIHSTKLHLLHENSEQVMYKHPTSVPVLPHSPLDGARDIVHCSEGNGAKQDNVSCSLSQHQCPQCSFIAQASSELQRHIDTVHVSELSGESFLSASKSTVKTLTTRRLSSFSSLRIKVRCNYCEYETTRQDHMRRHITRRHLQANPRDYTRIEGDIFLAQISGSLNANENVDCKQNDVYFDELHSSACSLASTSEKCSKTLKDVVMCDVKSKNYSDNSKRECTVNNSLKNKSHLDVVVSNKKENLSVFSKLDALLAGNCVPSKALLAVSEILDTNCPTQCVWCSYFTKHQASMRRHIFQHIDPSHGRLLECKHCGYNSHRPVHMRNHMAQHSGDGCWQCPGCSYRTARKDHFKRHIETCKRFQAPQSLS